MNSSINPQARPKLRWPLQIDYPISDGRRYVVLQCALGLVDEPLALIGEVAPLLAQLNGQNTVAQIVERFSSQGASLELVSQLIDLLDQHFFLEGERFDHFSVSRRNEYSQLEVRESALAGRSFPPDAEALKVEINGYLGKAKRPLFRPDGEMIGLVAPHIDYGRGGLCYGKAYSALKNEQHDLYLLIGTSHKYSTGLFHLSAKHFASPLGLLECDRNFIHNLAKLYGSERSFADEILHKTEHSLELQLPFLSMMPNRARIAPVLVGGFYEMMQAGQLPSQVAEYDEFVDALAQVLGEWRASGQKICFIAGVDMAHVGQSFGDTKPLTKDFLKLIETRDAIYLQAIQEQDKARLFEHVAEDGDARRICGFPTMYTLIDLCDRMGLRYSARIIDYSQAVDFKSDCAVTFAGMSFYL